MKTKRLTQKMLNDKKLANAKRKNVITLLIFKAFNIKAKQR